jgi:hypothetical protein
LKSFKRNHKKISSPNNGKSLNGSFFNTSMPSPPPVSFFDTSATEYSCAT